MVMSWRVALLLVSAVALCAADAEMEYPQVYELAEMAEGDGAYGRDLGNLCDSLVLCDLLSYCSHAQG